MTQGKTIGFLASDLFEDSGSEYLKDIYNGTETWLKENKKDHVLAPLGSIIQESYKEAIKSLSSQIVDRLILLPLGQDMHKFERDVIPELNTLNLPFVLIHSGSGNLPYNNVGFDAFKAGYLAGEHLIKLGHEDIGYLGQRIRSLRITDPLSGLKKACKDYNIPWNNKNILLPKRMNLGNTAQGTSFAAGLAAIPSYTRAVLASTDLVAYAVLQSFENQNIKVPEEVAVIGIDHLNTHRKYGPILTSVLHDFGYKGTKAIEILDGIMSGRLPGDIPQQFVLEPRIKVKITCGKVLSPH